MIYVFSVLVRLNVDILIVVVMVVLFLDEEMIFVCSRGGVLNVYVLNKNVVIMVVVG